MSQPQMLSIGCGVSSEVGRLRTVLLHRPGDELKRLTPRNSGELLFDGIPWLERAQEEHDVFAATLRAHGVEVLYLRDLLVEVLGVAKARADLVAAAVSDQAVGPALADDLRAHLTELTSEQLAEVVTAGLSYEELLERGELDRALRASLVGRISGPRSFAVPPLPNLLFTRDSSVWLGSAVAVTSPSTSARAGEAAVTRAIYRHAARFAAASVIYGAHNGTAGRYDYPEAFLEGGDVLLLADGVAAIGVGERTTPAGAETLAARAIAAGVVHTVLAIPIEQRRATMHLDTVCTMVDADAVVMYPPVAGTLRAYTVTAAGVTDAEPFLIAAARAMGIDRLRVIETGLDPVTAEREQWDDGNNTLAIAPRRVIAYERNVQTNARLEDAGIEVLRIPGSELGSGRGGPRCMSCPIARDPLVS